jgi:hypothetical protein
MTIRSFAKATGAVTFVAIVLTLMSIKAPRVRADGDDDDKDPSKIGFKIAPAPLIWPIKIGIWWGSAATW